MRLLVLVGIKAVAGPWGWQTRKVANKKPTPLQGGVGKFHPRRHPLDGQGVGWCGL